MLPEAAYRSTRASHRASMSRKSCLFNVAVDDLKSVQPLEGRNSRRYPLQAYGHVLEIELLQRRLAGVSIASPLQVSEAEPQLGQVRYPACRKEASLLAPNLLSFRESRLTIGSGRNFWACQAQKWQCISCRCSMTALLGQTVLKSWSVTFN